MTRRSLRRSLTALVSLAIALLLPAKNWLLVGSFTSSTWLGMNLAHMTTEQLDEATREQWIADGRLHPVARVRAFAPLTDYPENVRAPIPGLPPHPALAGKLLALAGGIYLFLFAGRLIRTEEGRKEVGKEAAVEAAAAELAHGSAQIGSPRAFSKERPLQPLNALISAAIFVAVIALAALNVAPIAACAFAGAVLLILLLAVRGRRTRADA